VSGSFDVADAPWVMELEQGFALTGMYWSDGQGEAQTFHDVALSPIDAHRVWAWAGPELPEGWQAVYDEAGGSGAEPASPAPTRAEPAEGRPLEPAAPGAACWVFVRP
jgi:hypothetical protein